jgi:hypothetical protein
VAASPELQELLERQRRAVVATQGLAAEEVPTALRTTVEGLTRPSGARRGVPRLAIALAAVVAAAVVAGVVLSGGPGAPSVAEAAQVATQAATAPAPPPTGTQGTKLAIAVDGVVFPDLRQFAGWSAVGARQAHIGDRDVTAVFYRKDGRRIGYVIVAGAGLAPPSGGQATTIRRAVYRTLRLHGRLGVTWRRRGHTCVLLGQASRPELLRLASWPLTPPRR